MGPKQVKCCRPEQMGTKEFSNMMKIISKKEESQQKRQRIGETR